MRELTEEERQRALERGKATLITEGEAVIRLCDTLDDSFVRAVELVLGCGGRLVVTGMGKSGAIGRKLAGTFSSTGTPALFLHPAEGIHGDLGAVTVQDVVLAISNSGETSEVVDILPAIARIGAGMIAMVGRGESTLGDYAQVILEIPVDSEACPLGLAPTASTTAALAMGDALALAVMEARKFTREDYALFHPGGALGRRLLMRVSDVMRTGSANAIVEMDTVLRDVLFEITRAGAGAASVKNDQGLLQGIITDGDVRRALLADANALAMPAREVMTRNCRTISPDRLAEEGLRALEAPPQQIGEIPVVNDGRPVGMLMLKDLVAAGIV